MTSEAYNRKTRCWEPVVEPDQQAHFLQVVVIRCQQLPHYQREVANSSCLEGLFGSYKSFPPKGDSTLPKSNKLLIVSA